MKNNRHNRKNVYFMHLPTCNVTLTISIEAILKFSVYVTQLYVRLNICVRYTSTRFGYCPQNIGKRHDFTKQQLHCSAKQSENFY